MHCTGIEPATSCVVDEYSYHYTKSVVKLVDITLTNHADLVQIGAR
jgi:hypothetical protein